MTKEEVTLFAAAIAAAASLAKLISDFVSARGTANRAAHRSVLQPHLDRLAASVHGVVAGAVLIHLRYKSGQEPAHALVNATAAGADLKNHRLEIRYALPGLEAPLRTLTRAPDWSCTYRGDASGDVLVWSLEQLGRRVDRTVSSSYRRGRPPSRWEQRRLRGANRLARFAWERRFATDGSEQTSGWRGRHDELRLRRAKKRAHTAWEKRAKRVDAVDLAAATAEDL
jgi:hypothetical protein